ncbi:hypothetical protein [Paraburkholderia sp. SIMBA_030]|uniref:hypothetical protein n=1 Tax=Paraburkholderia sp. SIMBA_030 TaxID=3085773 RepID=UPI003979CF33
MSRALAAMVRRRRRLERELGGHVTYGIEHNLMRDRAAQTHEHRPARLAVQHALDVPMARYVPISSMRATPPIAAR